MHAFLDFLNCCLKAYRLILSSVDGDVILVGLSCFSINRLVTNQIDVITKYIISIPVVVIPGECVYRAPMVDLALTVMNKNIARTGIISEPKTPRWNLHA